MADEFVGDPAEFEVVDGVVIIKWPGKPSRLCIPVSTFRTNLKRANRAMDEWSERQRGEVMPLAGRKRDSQH